MDVRAEDSTLFAGFTTEEAWQRVEHMAKVSIQAVTFVYDGRVIFCAGFCQLWPGVIEVWMIPSVYARSMPMFFGRKIRRYMDGIGRDFGAHRLQTTSFDDDFHKKWMKFLGFAPEGTAKQFTQDKRDMVYYARFF